jgi:hypothetical protein
VCTEGHEPRKTPGFRAVFIRLGRPETWGGEQSGRQATWHDLEFFGGAAIPAAIRRICSVSDATLPCPPMTQHDATVPLDSGVNAHPLTATSVQDLQP